LRDCKERRSGALGSIESTTNDHPDSYPRKTAKSGHGEKRVVGSMIHHWDA